MARPTIYTEDILIKAQAYFDYLPEDENVHSIEGLAEYLDIARNTIYDWSSQEDKKEFSHIVSKILNKQGKTLINKGLDGKFNSSITKVMLTKHGYRDAVDTDVTSKGDKVAGISPEALALAKEYEEKVKQSL